MIGNEQDGSCVHLAPDAGGAELGEAFEVAITLDQPQEAQHQRLEVGRSLNAGGLLLEARSYFRFHGMAQQLSCPEADSDVEDMFEVGHDGGPLQAPGRIVADTLDDPRPVEADEESLNDMAEAVVVPQQRSYPRK